VHLLGVSSLLSDEDQHHALSALRGDLGAVDAASSGMDQPLWQILFNIAMIGFVVRRAAVGLALYADRTQPALWGVYVGLCAVCAFAGIAVLFSRRWVIAALVALGAAFTLTTFVELSVGTVAPAVWLVAQWLVGLAGCAVLLVMALRSKPAS
jgi:hypothetical protein